MNTTVQVKAFHPAAPWSTYFTPDEWTEVEVRKLAEDEYYVSNVLGCSKSRTTPEDAIEQMLYENGYTAISVK